MKRIIRLSIAGLFIGVVSFRAIGADNFNHCFTASHWCRYDKRDAITHVTTHIEMLSAQEPIYFHGIFSRLTLETFCRDSDPWLHIVLSRSLSYGGLSMRYRVDPNGTVGTAFAKPGGGGDTFDVQDSKFMLRDMAGGRKLTVELKFGDGTRTKTAFDIDDTDKAINRLNCAKAALPEIREAPAEGARP